MGTRGLLGIRNNKKFLYSRYRNFDCYYDCLGEDVLEYYFDDCGNEILQFGDDDAIDDKSFLQDGLWCEYAYIYNEENDTLEVYRGFFKQKQTFNLKEQILNNLEKEGEKYYCHLIIIIDKKIHKKEDVLKAFNEYSKQCEEDEVEGYPERKVIPLKLKEGYKLLV